MSDEAARREARLLQLRSDRAFLRLRYPALFAEVTSIVNEADPLGLLRTGAPLDQYKVQIGTILARLYQARSEENVQDIVREEFERWGGLDDEPPLPSLDELGLAVSALALYDDIGVAVWQAWQPYLKERRERGIRYVAFTEETIQEASPDGMVYCDNEGVPRTIDFEACIGHNFEQLVRRGVSKATMNERAIEWYLCCVGERDAFNVPPYIQFYTDPPTRFEFDPLAFPRRSWSALRALLRTFDKETVDLA